MERGTYYESVSIDLFGLQSSVLIAPHVHVHTRAQTQEAGGCVHGRLRKQGSHGLPERWL